MPIAEFRLPDGRIAEFRVPDGTTPEQAQQMIAPMISSLPQAEPGILSQIASLPKEVGKGFIRGLTVDPVSGAASLAYTGAQAAGMEGKPFEETGFGKSLGKAQAALAPGKGTISEFGGGVGSMLSFLPGGVLKGGLGLATRLAQTGAVGSEEARQRADQARLEGMDVSAGDKLTAQLGGTAVGFTELAPLERIANPLRAVLRGIPASKADEIAPGLFNSAKRMLATGGVEGLQEGLSNIAQDLIAKGIYNPNLDVGQSALGDAAMGASVGAFAQGAIELLTKGKRTQMYNQLKQEEQTKADEERIKGIQDIQEARNKATVNPVGFFTAQDLSPDYVDAVNQARLEQGKVKLNKFSIEDLVESGAHPEEINQLIAERTGFDGSAALTPEQVLATAQEKNIDVQNKGFTDFLRRTTGSETLETMSQPQLHAAFKSLEAAPAFEEPTALQEGSNSVKFTQQDYDSVIGAVKSVMPKEGMITLDQAMNAAAKVKTEEEAKALLKIAADSGDLNAVEKSRYDLVDAEGSVLRTYANRADAERAATQRGLGVQESTSINFTPTAEEVITSEDGTSIRKGTFKQATGYEIRSDAAVLDVAQTAEEADAKADRMQELREKKAKQLQDQAIKLEEEIAKSSEKLEELKAEGKFESPLFKKAEDSIAKNNEKLKAQIARLNAQSMTFLAPLQVSPRVGKPFKPTGYTVFDQNGNPSATFKTVDEARNQAPTVGKPTQEFQAQADALIKQLRPVMDRLGLAPVRLNIEKAIKTPQGSADGYYLNNLIAISLESPNPVRTLRHEGIHALKELGAFTPDQWRVLSNKAKSEWMGKYDIRSRYKHLSEEEMIEEAISDAFSDFDQTKPPAGMVGALFNKIKLFLESLGNALRGMGFNTAQGLFERVEAGEMRPSTPAQSKQKLSISQPTQQVKKRSMEDLEKAIPLKDRVVSKNPTRMVDGKPFSQANISKSGVGFLPIKKYGEEDAQGMINKFWLDSINESGGQYIKDLVDSLGAKPPTVDFINRALSLPELYRYWYEISGETVANLPLPNEIQKTLLDLISATSLLTKPLPNAQRAIGALAEVLQGKPIETDIISLKPVQDALRNPDLETLKFGNFAGTMKYVSGMTDKAPITTNDRQVAFAFDMEANDFAKNPAMYEVVSRFYNKLRDAQNALLPKKSQPYEAWQMQALTWVEQRGDNTSFNTKTSDDYQQAIQAITKILKEENIPLVDGKISMITLLDKRVPKILSQTMERFQNALKATIESNTLLNTEGAEANNEYANLQNVDKPWSKNLQKEFLRIQRRVFEDLSSKGVLNDFASAIIGRRINISRIDTTSRGTFESKLSPNMRVPLVGFLSENKPYTLNTEEAEVLLAYLGGSLDQAAMAASVFKPSDAKNADTFRVLIENKNVTDDEIAALEKAVGYPLNIFESANGSVVEINVGGYDVMPKLPEVSSAFEDVLGDIPMRVIPTSYESIYITKDKDKYSKSYQEIIDAYATSKFGGSESSGIRRKFDANIDRSILKIREIVERRNKEFGEFTAEAREKLGKYEAQRLKKQAQELKEQAKQVTGGKASLSAPKTPEFKQWFGKSKIVGRDGKPKVMYHGTARDITEFRPKQANAIFVTDNPEFAASFADISENWMVNHAEEFFTPKQIKEFEAKATQIVDKQGYGFVEDELNDLLRANLPTKGNILPVFVKAEDPFDYANPNHIKRLKEWIDDFDTLQKISRGSWQTIESPRVQQALEQEGFDSFYVLEGGHKNLAVYKPSQIKSATGNIGTFDINKPDIRYSLRSPDTPEFKQWFKGSKAVNEDGSPLVLYHGTTADFDEFKRDAKKRNRTGNPDGFYFSPDASDTTEYLKENYDSDKYDEGSNVMPVYISVKRPFNYSGTRDFGKTPINAAMIEQFEKELREENPHLSDDWIRGKVNIFKETESGSPFPNITFSTAAMTRVLKAGGYDGMRDGRHWIAFDPNQVKSVFNEKPTEGGKISYSLRDNIDPKTVAAIDRTTTVRPEKGFVDRIIGAISPDSMAHFRQAYINKYEAIERLTGQIGRMFGSVELMADNSAIAAALQADRAAGVAAESFKRGVPVFRNGFTSVDDLNGQVKGLIPILEPLAKYKDPFAFRAFQFYAATRRGRRLTAEGREKLFTPDEINRGQALAAKFPEFKQVFDEYQKYNQGLVKFMKDTGVISDAEAKIWTQNWDYIPFYRQMDGESTAGPKVFSAIAGVGKPKVLKGGEEALADFMETVVRNSRAAIEAGMKNEAARRVMRDMLRLNQGQLVPAGTSGADIVTVKENGVTKHYQVADPLLVEALKGLNLPQLPFLEILAMPSNVLRNLVTKDPGFMIANLARDSMQAWVTSGTNLTPLVDTFKQAGKVLAGMSPEAEALARAGLFGGFDFANDIQSSSREVEKELRKRAKDFSPKDIALMPLNKIWDALDKGSTASDVATRVEIYKRVLKETGSEAEAIYQAMEVMNFSRKGNSALIRILSAVVPFLNARIQGLDVLYRSGFGKMATQNREAMQKAFITRSLTILALSSMYWMLASDTDEYKTAEAETRDNYWIFGNVRIPIPFEIGVLFKVFPERILGYFFGQDTGADLKESIVRNITSTLAFNPIPQALLPLVENTANYSFFTGKPIVGMGLEGLEAKYQAGASTSILAQEIGKATNSSPAKIDNLIKGYTGTLGTYAAMMLDSVMRGEGDPTKASLKLEQMPVFKRFFSPSEGTGTISAYYDLKNEVETSTRTINFLERTGSTEDLQQYMTGKGGKLQAIKPYIQTLDKDMTMLRDTRKMVMMSQMEPDAKRAVLDNIRSAEVGLTSRIQYVKKMLED
jgi:hypothetical protein